MGFFDWPEQYPEISAGIIYALVIVLLLIFVFGVPAIASYITTATTDTTAKTSFSPGLSFNPADLKHRKY